MRIIVWIAVVALVACGKDKGGDGGGETRKVAPPFTLTVEKVEHADQLAPNKTYADQGLAKKPADGKVFTCVFYKLTNTSKDKQLVSLVFLVDAAGARTQPSIEAAGSLPDEWKQDALPTGDLAAGASASKINCYELPKPGTTTGMKLLIEDTGWGAKHPPWELTAPLPQ
jgi:hypothetical protein